MNNPGIIDIIALIKFEDMFPIEEAFIAVLYENKVYIVHRTATLTSFPFVFDFTTPSVTMYMHSKNIAAIVVDINRLIVENPTTSFELAKEAQSVIDLLTPIALDNNINNIEFLDFIVENMNNEYSTPKLFMLNMNGNNFYSTVESIPLNMDVDNCYGLLS